VPKSLKIDQDNLHMKLSALTIDLSDPSHKEGFFKMCASNNSSGATPVAPPGICK